MNLSNTLNQITNISNNKFNNFALNENLGFLNSANSNKNSNNANNILGFDFKDKLNNQIKNTAFLEENLDQEHQRNLRFSFNNMLGNTAGNNPNKQMGSEAAAAAASVEGNFNKENIYEKIDISNDNINLNQEESSERKCKLIDSENNKSGDEFNFGKGNKNLIKKKKNLR